MVFTKMKETAQPDVELCAFQSNVGHKPSFQMATSSVERFRFSRNVCSRRHVWAFVEGFQEQRIFVYGKDRGSRVPFFCATLHVRKSQ